MTMTTIPILPATKAESAVRTTCPYCGVGCGVLATPQADGSVGIAGDPAHPSNAGRLCVKGSALGETISLDGRLLYPAMRERSHDVETPPSTKPAPLQRVSWDTALDTVARGFRRIVDEHGPDSVALYVSGQLLTEDYYVANKLMKGFIGTANIDTNSRLCMSSAVAGHKRAFGEDLVPVCYDDLEAADLIVLVGSNTAWCHPILFQRIVRAKEARPGLKVVVVDPRHTATCELADLHLPIKPGTDVWLFNGLLSFLSRRGVVDRNFVTLHTNGPDAALQAAGTESDDVEAVAKACKLKLDDLLTFYNWFAGTERTITAFSMGVNQSTAGTDKVNSIINCHLLTGRIGRVGMGPFSITGQPNAMGGREVGGLANMLAAHMELNEPAHRDLVQTFWNAPRMADKVGLKAVDLFNAIEDGRVKAVWIMGTNPVVSLPDADQARRALAKCELVVASDIVEATDTTVLADVVLPALGWGEKDGTVTNSERRISRQRAFLPAPGEARADWHIIADVARRMGYDGFDFQSPRDVFDEHARLSAYANGADGVRRAFHLGGLIGLDADAYNGMTPVQWPVAMPGSSEARLFSDGCFAYTDGRARFVPTSARAPAHAADGEYPLILNTGRVRDQWHTMTRTGRAPKLADHVPEPFVDLHPHDALLAGVREGNLARVSSRWGSVVARVRMTGGIARGSVFVPIHWSGQFASDARVGAVVNPVVDPVSGEPEFKHTPVMVEPFDVAWHGFVLSRRALDTDDATWWTRIQGKQFVRYELAGRQQLGSVHDWARKLLGVTDPHADWLEYEDTTARVYRAVYVVDDRIEACVFLSPRPDLPSRNWLAGLFAQARLEDLDRAGVLLGQPMEAGADVGPTVCSCFGVGRNTICDAIRTQGLQSTGEITACLKAGGNCGSCVPELKRLLVEARVQQAA